MKLRIEKPIAFWKANFSKDHDKISEKIIFHLLWVIHESSTSQHRGQQVAGQEVLPADHGVVPGHLSMENGAGETRTCIVLKISYSHT